jgi:hypothetical protein
LLRSSLELISVAGTAWESSSDYVRCSTFGY